jgi:Ala-tRNA(Pro) deacylase
MSIPKKLENYLFAEHVPYRHLTHRQAYSAQEVAAAQHVPGRMMAKAVMLKSDGDFVMAVLPANRKIDLTDLRAQTGLPNIDLANEWEFAWMFPDCEVGAMSPFGNLYGIPVYVDASLATQSEIAFNAGTHVDVIRMKYQDFERLVRPTVIRAGKKAA